MRVFDEAMAGVGNVVTGAEARTGGGGRATDGFLSTFVQDTRFICKKHIPAAIVSRLAVFALPSFFDAPMQASIFILLK